MEIKSLASIEFDCLFAAFSKAFACYEVQQTRQQLESMLIRRGFDPELSFAAFEGNEIVAFTLNGIGNFGGIKTAYDTGTGTIEDYRGKGLATEIFSYSIPFLKEKGVRQYLLEVLQHNPKAISVYQKLGFETTREFNYFIQNSNEIVNATELIDSQFEIRRITVDEVTAVYEFSDFQPSWQNSLEAIIRCRENFVCYGAFSKQMLVGYCVFEPASGDLTQICVGKKFRRKGIASALLGTMLQENKAEIVKVINNETVCISLSEFLRSKNIEEKGKQFEMVKSL